MSHDPADSVIIDEKIIRAFGICIPFVQLMKEHDMIGKNFNEILQFVQEKGKQDNIEDLQMFLRSRKFCEYIKQNIYADFYTVTGFYVKNPFIKDYDFCETLEQAKEKQQEIKTKLTEYLIEQEIDIENYMLTHKNEFQIEEEILTYYHDKVRTVVE